MRTTRYHRASSGLGASLMENVGTAPPSCVGAYTVFRSHNHCLHLSSRLASPPNYAYILYCNLDSSGLVIVLRAIVMVAGPDADLASSPVPVVLTDPCPISRSWCTCFFFAARLSSRASCRRSCIHTFPGCSGRCPSLRSSCIRVFVVDDG